MGFLSHLVSEKKATAKSGFKILVGLLGVEPSTNGL